MQVVLFNWSFDENEKQDLNYHRTVLEDYWELEARTGTVGKLQVSTFSFSEYFLTKLKMSPLKFDETVWICSQKQVKMSENLIQNVEIWHFRVFMWLHSGISWGEISEMRLSPPYVVLNELFIQLKTIFPGRKSKFWKFDISMNFFLDIVTLTLGREKTHYY